MTLPPIRIIPVAAGVLAAGLVLVMTTPNGPALDPDSMSYFGAAQSLVHSGTLRVPWVWWDDADSTGPLVDYPPGYPAVLAGPIALGASPVIAARWIQAIAAGVAFGTFIWLLLMTTGPWAAGLGGVLLLAMPAAVEIHLWSLSEPLFIALLSLTLASMVRRPERPGLAGTLALLANLVRFAGVFLIGAVTLWAIGLPAASWRERARRGLLAAAPGAVLQVWWVARGVAPGGSGFSPFDLETYAGFGATLKEGWGTIQDWLVPSLPESPWRAMLTVVVLAVLGTLIWRTIQAEPRVRLLLAAVGVLSCCYVGVVIFARLHVVSGVPFDMRILGPLFMLLTLAIATALATQHRSWPSSRSRIVGLVVMAWLVGAARWDAEEIRITREYGLGYESPDWQTSDVANWLRGPGAGRIAYTNDPAGVWHVTHRPVRAIPTVVDADTLRAFSALFLARPSVLLGFDSPMGPLVSPDTLARMLGLVQVAQFEHGTAWVARADSIP